jgi:uncharacterized protein (TIRG00374 family)
MDTAQTDVGVVIRSRPAAGNVRRAADVLRLVLALAVLLAGLLVAIFAHVGVRTSERALVDTVVTLSPRWRDPLTAAVQLVVVMLPAGLIGVLAVRRRFAVVARLLLGGAVATGVAVLLAHLVLGRSHPSVWPSLLAGRGWVFAVTFPPAAWLAGLTAILTVAGAELSRRWRGALWWLAAAAAVVEVMVGGFLPIDAVVAASLGATVGAAILLGFGEPPRRPAAVQVAAALAECGIELESLDELAPAGAGPAMFRAVTGPGRALAVRVFAGDDRDRDRLARFTRWLLVRDAQDDRAGTTVESAAEHEMLALVAAARAGGRVPEAVVAYPVRGPGPTGALVAWLEIDGRALDQVPPERVSDETLSHLWGSVASLHRHRLAHRQLRTDNVTVDDSGKAWLTGLALAELGATDGQLAADGAELMASLAVLVGAERAVSSAVKELGGNAVTAAAGYLQPLALSGSTRARVRSYDRARSVPLSGSRPARRLRPGARSSVLADARAAVGQAVGQPPVKAQPLARFTWKTVLALLGAFAVIYLVLPQLANAGAAVHALGHADWWWVLAAVPAIFVAQAFSTLVQLGAIPARLPFGPTYVVQFGGSFLNRVTPNNVGGMALNFRYLQKAGVDTGAATGSVGLQAVVGVAANLVLVTAFFAQTGRHTAVHFSLHTHQWLLLALAALIIAAALLVLTPPGRRFFHDKIWAFLRSAGTTIAGVAKSPRDMTLIAVGALGGPLIQITALSFCVHALGGHLPFAQIGAVYLGAHLLASAAPVPGGLGALEAAMIAGLSALGMPVGAAASAVLIYRLLTFWLTIPVGWTCLKIAQGRGYV